MHGVSPDKGARDDFMAGCPGRELGCHLHPPTCAQHPRRPRAEDRERPARGLWQHLLCCLGPPGQLVMIQ